MKKLFYLIAAIAILAPLEARAVYKSSSNTGGGGGGSGTVTSTSVVSANGFAGTVATATTTPAITLSTTCNGVCKGNGTAISTATANTDYQGAITLTTTGTSGAATLTGAALNIPQYTSSQFQAAMAAETQLSIGGL